MRPPCTAPHIILVATRRPALCALMWTPNSSRPPSLALALLCLSPRSLSPSVERARHRRCRQAHRRRPFLPLRASSIPAGVTLDIPAPCCISCAASLVAQPPAAMGRRSRHRYGLLPPWPASLGPPWNKARPPMGVCGPLGFPRPSAAADVASLHRKRRALDVMCFKPRQGLRAGFRRKRGVDLQSLRLK
jgi:hypothetical protein